MLNMSSAPALAISPKLYLPSSLSLSLPSPKSVFVSYGMPSLPRSCPLSSSTARASIIAILDRAISKGHLSIADSTGIYYFGSRTKGCNEVHLNVVSDDFWSRVLLSVHSPLSSPLPNLFLLQLTGSRL